MSLELAAAGLAVAAGAALQSATGFGFSLLAAPLVYAAFERAHAVGVLLALGAELAVLTLLTERRRPAPHVRTVGAVCACAVPGAVAGVAVLRALSPLALQAAVTVGALATLLVRRVPAGDLCLPAWLAGAIAGALTTTTSMNGPPLLVHLLGRGHPPAVVRDTLTACFLGLGAVGAGALAATGTDAAPPGDALALLAPLVLAGQLAGRRGFARLAAGGRYEATLTAVLLVALAAGMVGVVV